MIKFKIIFKLIFNLSFQIKILFTIKKILISNNLNLLKNSEYIMHLKIMIIKLYNF
jgi:hypothetical protein